MSWYAKTVLDINQIVLRGQKHGDYEISQMTVYSLLAYMKDHVPEDCVSAWIVPSNDGTLNANWEINNVNVDIAAHPDGKITYWVCHEDVVDEDYGDLLPDDDMHVDSIGDIIIETFLKNYIMADHTISKTEFMDTLKSIKASN